MQFIQKPCCCLHYLQPEHTVSHSALNHYVSFRVWIREIRECPGWIRPTTGISILPMWTCAGLYTHSTADMCATSHARLHTNVAPTQNRNKASHCRMPGFKGYILRVKVAFRRSYDMLKIIFSLWLCVCKLCFYPYPPPDQNLQWNLLTKLLQKYKKNRGKKK